MVFQTASVGNKPSADSASSSTVFETGESRLIFAEPLLAGGVRFVFAVPAAEEFGIEETPDLLGETWRLLPEDEFKMIREIREDNVDSQNRLTIILPKAAGKATFPSFDAATLKSSQNQRKETRAQDIFIFK